MAALESAGASVTRLDGVGLVDLLCGFRGVTYLLECKDSHGAFKRGGKKTESGLRESQEVWWSKWKGAPPVVVTTPEEALAAIGAIPLPRSAPSR